jgi:hypothetical protein
LECWRFVREVIGGGGSDEKKENSYYVSTRDEVGWRKSKGIRTAGAQALVLGEG